jgi:hypothetical protein
MHKSEITHQPPIATVPPHRSGSRFGFQTDWPPSRAFNHSFKFPTIWTAGELRKLEHSSESKQAPLPFRHNNVYNATFPLKMGGFHLTSVAILQSLLYKYLHNAEGGTKVFLGDVPGGMMWTTGEMTRM